jgi:ubiquinone/menaquinone biosynthesis C-methylase UbiE
MTAKPHFFKEHFQKKDTASTYEATVGGCTRALAKDIISAYLGSHSLDGKVVLDNACGTGVVTKEVLLHAGIGNVKIDAADISPAMVEALGNSLSATDAARVTPVVMDAQVYPY